MSTHNVCFGPKIRKLGIPLQTPFFFYIKVGFRGYTFHRHVFLMIPSFNIDIQQNVVTSNEKVKVLNVLRQ